MEMALSTLAVLREVTISRGGGDDFLISGSGSNRLDGGLVMMSPSAVQAMIRSCLI